MVLHKCDNRRCCNPDHLYLGTHEDNMRDLVVRGRSTKGRRKPKKNGKLTDADIFAIRDLLSNTSYTQTEIASMYNLNPCTVSRIKNAKRFNGLRQDSPIPNTRKKRQDNGTVRQIQRALNNQSTELSAGGGTYKVTVSGTQIAFTTAGITQWIIDSLGDIVDNAGGNLIDGRDVSVDGTKLDGIEAGATADQTDAEIKTAYENNADTNAFTDAEQTKLGNITLANTDNPVLPSYTVGTLPSAATAGAMIYVTDEVGGAVPAFADGTNFRRVTDRAIVS